MNNQDVDWVYNHETGSTEAFSGGRRVVVRSQGVRGWESKVPLEPYKEDDYEIDNESVTF